MIFKMTVCKRSTRDLMAKVLDSIPEESSNDWVHFRNNTLEKGMNLFINPAKGWIVSLLDFYKDSFGIK